MWDYVANGWTLIFVLAKLQIETLFTVHVRQATCLFIHSPEACRVEEVNV